MLLVTWTPLVALLGFGDIFPAIVEAQDEPDLSRSYGISSSSSQRSCSFRRQEGVCVRSSECRRPSRRNCLLSGLVCCLEVKEPEVTRAPQRKPPEPKKPEPTSRPQSQDQTLAECGTRFAATTPSASPPNNRRRGRNRPRGKRNEQCEKFCDGDPYWRSKRNAVRPVVVGGVESRPNSWPWMAAIYKKATSGNTSRFLCGASLISGRYVMSAAHCFDSERGNINPSIFLVRLGSHTTRDGTEFPVESVTLHPNYQPRQYYNDLSVLKLSRNVAFSAKMKPICMPTSDINNRARPGESVTVTGWGDTAFGGIESKVLREVSIPVVSLKNCNESYSRVASATFPRGITDSFVCAGLSEGGKDACQGDSGGPLVINTGTDKWVQLGVVSFGYGCAQAGYPGVYTRIAKYTDWLKRNTDI